MKLEFQAKFLQHLNKKKQEEGFTLIELLVVIIIIGILAAIALPSLLGQVNKAKQAEAKNNIGALNRAQQAYQLEYSLFATDVTQLGVGIKTQTENYYYTLDATISSAAGIITSLATAQKPALKSYAGLVGTTPGDLVTGEVLTLAAACESETPTQTKFANSVSTDVLASSAPCGIGYKSLGK